MGSKLGIFDWCLYSFLLLNVGSNVANHNGPCNYEVDTIFENGAYAVPSKSQKTIILGQGGLVTQCL